jgi:hypothetical protein
MAALQLDASSSVGGMLRYRLSPRPAGRFNGLLAPVARSLSASDDCGSPSIAFRRSRALAVRSAQLFVAKVAA